MSAPMLPRPESTAQAERVLLGAAMLDPERYAAALEPRRFAAELGHDAVAATIRRLHQLGQPVDLVSVREELVRMGDLERVGDERLLAICDRLDPLEHVEAAERVVRTASARRDVVVEAERLARLAMLETSDPAHLLRDGEARLRGLRERVAPSPASLPDMAALCRAMPGKYRRVPTHCLPLDELCGGGLQTKRLMVLGGAPGDFKTTLSLWLVTQMAERGAITAPTECVLIAADEGRDGLLSRLGQMGGATRAGLEDEDLVVARSHWGHVEQMIARLPNLSIVDPTEENDPSTVDEAIDLAAARARQRSARLVVVVDSLQTAPFREDVTAREQSTREKIDGRISALRRGMKHHDATVIAISELNRGAYGKDGQLTLAAFKESGGIEYGVDVACLLRRVPDTYCTDVHVLKNRLGDTGVFRLERAADCTFSEVPIDTEGDFADEDPRQARVEEMAERILTALLQTQVPITSQKTLRGIVAGNNGLKEDAITHLIATGQIEGGSGRPFRRKYDGEVP